MSTSNTFGKEGCTIKTFHLEEEVDSAEFCSPVTTQSVQMFAPSSCILSAERMERVPLFHKSHPGIEIFFNCYRISSQGGAAYHLFRGVSVWREATREPQSSNWLWTSEDIDTAIVYGYVQVFRLIDPFYVIAMDDPRNIATLRSLYKSDVESPEADEKVILRDLSRFDLAYRVTKVAHQSKDKAGQVNPQPSGNIHQEREVVVRGSELENDRIVAEWLLNRLVSLSGVMQYVAVFCPFV